MNSFEIVDINFDPGTDEEFYLASLKDEGSLEIALKGARSGLQLKFSFKYAFCYLKTNESYRLETSRTLPEGRYILLKACTSPLLDWFHKESQSLHIDEGVVHFMIVSGDDFIDVLSRTEPLVTWRPSR